MIRPLAIDHIVLRTSRLESMLGFYCDVLGCKVERETPPNVGLTQLRAGSALIDLVTLDSELGRAGGAAPGNSGNNMDHFCLQIEPVEEQKLIDYLSAAGISTGEFAMRNGAEGEGRSLYITDPQGNTVELRNRRGG